MSNAPNGDQLRAYIERIEVIEAERADLAQDVRDTYSEAKGTGYDPKIIRRIVAARKKDKEARDEENALLALYSDAIGQPDLFGSL